MAAQSTDSSTVKCSSLLLWLWHFALQGTVPTWVRLQAREGLFLLIFYF